MKNIKLFSVIVLLGTSLIGCMKLDMKTNTKTVDFTPIIGSYNCHSYSSFINGIEHIYMPIISITKETNTTLKITLKGSDIDTVFNNLVVSSGDNYSYFFLTFNGYCSVIGKDIKFNYGKSQLFEGTKY
ncbi:MAG: hypothetical protein ACOYO1_18340 [Bacteroidales bacterium]